MSDDEDKKLKSFTDRIVRPDFGSARVLDNHDDPAPSCMHYYIQLFSRSERVFCRQCKLELHPFDVLKSLAREWMHVTWLQSDKEKLHGSIDELKKEEQRLKSRIRNAKAGIERDSLVETFVTELIAKIKDAQTMRDIYKIDSWKARYNWYTPAQRATITNELFAAKQRCEANARDTKKRARRRGVSVIDGGKSKKKLERTPE